MSALAVVVLLGAYGVVWYEILPELFFRCCQRICMERATLASYCVGHMAGLSKKDEAKALDRLIF